MRILVVCGAGASSTFVAQRLRRAAHQTGLAWNATAATLASLAVDVDAADVVLVGPHLVAELDAIRRLAAPRAALVIDLPADIFSDLDGTRTLALVEEALATSPPDAAVRAPHPTPQQQQHPAPATAAATAPAATEG